MWRLTVTRNQKKYFALGLLTCVFALALINLIGHQQHDANKPLTARDVPIEQELREMIKSDADDIGADDEIYVMQQFMRDKNVNPTKVVLYAYMRGGSSLLGQMYNLHPDSSYWYEPYEALYNSMVGTAAWTIPLDITQSLFGKSRYIDGGEKRKLLKYLEDLLNCNIDELPTETLNPKPFSFEKMSWMSEYRECLLSQVDKQVLITECSTFIGKYCPKHVQTSMDQLCDVFIDMVRRNDSDLYHQEYNIPNITELSHEERQQTINAGYGVKYRAFQDHLQCLENVRVALQPCTPILKESCERTTIRSAKVLRLDLSTVLSMVEENPDVKVIYSMRDPRGILLSTANVMLMAKNSRGSMQSEAYGLCRKMYSDIKTYRTMVLSHPNNIYMIKYEDIARDPLTAVRALYNFTGVPFDSSVEQQLLDMTYNDVSGSAYSQVRRNSSETASAWEQQLGAQQKKVIDAVCKKVLKYAEYEI